MSLSVHLLQGFDKKWVARLQAILDSGIKLTWGQTLPYPPDYHILIAGRPGKDHLEASCNLHTLIIPWAGLPSVTRRLLADFPDLKVHNLHHNALPTAEMAIALMLAAARIIVPVDRALRKNDWRALYDYDFGSSGKDPSRGPLLLSGKTALIIGYGAIGRHIGQVCQGMGMNIIGVTRSARAESEDLVPCFSVEKLPELLARANVVFISLPLTSETRGMIGKKELALLPDEAILVNIARGPVVDEKSLYQELKSGRIRAGPDVWYNYPKSKKARTSTPPSQHPFHRLDNVVMTPHIGGHSDETENLRIKELARLLSLAAAGEELPNRVDYKRGY